METITLEITLWDGDKTAALIRKILTDARVITVERVDLP